MEDLVFLLSESKPHMQEWISFALFLCLVDHHIFEKVATQNRLLIVVVVFMK